MPLGSGRGQITQSASPTAVRVTNGTRPFIPFSRRGTEIATLYHQGSLAMHLVESTIVNTYIMSSIDPWDVLTVNRGGTCVHEAPLV